MNSTWPDFNVIELAHLICYVRYRLDASVGRPPQQKQSTCQQDKTSMLKASNRLQDVSHRVRKRSFITIGFLIVMMGNGVVVGFSTPTLLSRFGIASSNRFGFQSARPERNFNQDLRKQQQQQQQQRSSGKLHSLVRNGMHQNPDNAAPLFPFVSHPLFHTAACQFGSLTRQTPLSGSISP